MRVVSGFFGCVLTIALHENIMFRRYGIVVNNIKKKPEDEMKAYQTPQERYDIDIKKISLVRPQGRGQGKFRVFTTPKGGMYLGVLSDSGNSILETGHFSDAEKQLLSLHKARDCLGWSAAQDKKPKHNECLPCKRTKILGQQEKNLELCSSNKTPLDCWNILHGIWRLRPRIAKKIKGSPSGAPLRGADPGFDSIETRGAILGRALCSFSSPESPERS